MATIIEIAKWTNELANSELRRWSHVMGTDLEIETIANVEESPQRFIVKTKELKAGKPFHCAIDSWHLEITLAPYHKDEEVAIMVHQFLHFSAFANGIDVDERVKEMKGIDHILFKGTQIHLATYARELANFEKKEV